PAKCLQLFGGDGSHAFIADLHPTDRLGSAIDEDPLGRVCDDVPQWCWDPANSLRTAPAGSRSRRIRYRSHASTARLSSPPRGRRSSIAWSFIATNAAGVAMHTVARTWFASEMSVISVAHS